MPLSQYVPVRAAAAGAAIALLLPVGSAAAEPPLTAWGVWCLDPDNLALVVRTAELDGYGRATGADRARIVPTGSQVAVNVDDWRRAHPEEFKVACLTTYKAFRGRAISSDDLDRATTAEIRAIEKTKQGLSTDEETAILSAAGLLTTIFGVVGGFAVSKRSRDDERRHAEADALDEELATLASNVDTLRERSLSSGARPADYLTTRQLAVHLRSKIPKPEAGEAASSLAKLIATLGAVQPRDPNESANRLGADFEAVNRHVSALASRLRKG